MVFSSFDVLQHDLEPESRKFFIEVLRGLCKPYKELPCKYIYDERGSKLFDQITELDEYYLTRTETQILHTCHTPIAEAVGENCVVIEYGSGSSAKTPILLESLEQPVAYVPVDISREHLMQSASRLQYQLPEIEVLPICADYTGTVEYPEEILEIPNRLIFFPGSTLGNFDPTQAVQFLRTMRAVCGAEGKILIGIDLQKDLSILIPAYDDAQGITAEFNQNILLRINHELNANFNLPAFRYHAFFNEQKNRVEMQQISIRKQEVTIGGTTIEFDQDEPIHTESSYKYTLDQFAQLAFEAGLHSESIWMDPNQWFSIHLLVPVH
ncbi:MAG: L-histidine N(alpha)-methyltransferase [bacterium]